MLSSNPRSTASIGGHPLHAMLVPIPITCFIATFLCDLVYWKTAAMQWANISAWLLTVGLIVSVFVASAGIIDFFGDPNQKSVFLEHLNSPFGVVLVGHDPYVANTDAVIRCPYSEGQTQITDPGTRLCDLPRRPH